MLSDLSAMSPFLLWQDPFPVHIDTGRLEDADDLSEIHETGFLRGWSAAEMEALLVQEGVISVVARRGSLLGSRRPIGFVLVRNSGEEAEVLALAVHPRHRRRGIGRRLMDEVLRRLYADRCGALFLEVDEHNLAALALYRRLGFREVGRRANYYPQPGAPASAALVLRADLR